jgi:regulator of protease activity HflC (stomatin/prohibitin superfamily)
VKKFILILSAMLLTLSVAGCASVSTQPDEVAIAYTGGPIEGTKYDQVIQPGSGLVWLGIQDQSYVYPTTTRTYTISSVASEGDRGVADMITAPTKEGVETHWELAVYFKLNTSKIRSFHENVGLKFDAWTPEGWDKMLNDVFRQQIENTVQAVSRKHTADDIYKSAEVFDSFNAEISQGLKDQINNVFGAAYFCGPTYDGTIKEDSDDNEVPCPELEVAVKKVTISNGDVVKSYEDQKTSANNQIIAENDGQKKIIEAQRQADANIAEAKGKADAQAQLAEIYNDPAYIEYLKALAMQQCAGNSNCTLIITNDQNGGVNVNVQPQG